MTSRQRRKLRKKTNFKLLLFTFLGAFILFFLTFTYLLPIVTPEVEIPALTEEHTLNSVTSHDFKGRIDPRLKDIENWEISEPLKYTSSRRKENNANMSQKEIEEPVSSISNEDAWKFSNTQSQDQKTFNFSVQQQKEEEKDTDVISDETKDASEHEIKTSVSPPLPARPPVPRPPSLNNNISLNAPKPIFFARVTVGDYSNPRDARLVSESLIKLNYSPFIRERNGRYTIQVASFSEPEKAASLVKELKGNNFEAKIIYE